MLHKIVTNCFTNCYKLFYKLLQTTFLFHNMSESIKNKKQTKPSYCPHCNKTFISKRRANKCIMSHSTSSPVYKVREQSQQQTKRKSPESGTSLIPYKKFSSFDDFDEIEFEKLVEDLKAKQKLMVSLCIIPTGEQIKLQIADSIGKCSLSQPIILEMLTQKVDSLNAEQHELVAIINDVELPLLKRLSDQSSFQYERTQAHKAEVEAKIMNGEYDLKYLLAYKQHHKVLSMYGELEIDKLNPVLDLLKNIKNHFNAVAGAINFNT